VVLGIAAYVAQMLAGGFLSRGRSRMDRLYLAFSQQNGLTAIVLALVLEPDFPGAVAVIAPAIVVTNVLYAVGSAVVTRLEKQVPVPVPLSPWMEAARMTVRATRARRAPSAEPVHPKPGTVR